jgi:hypothetical protein
MDRARWTSVRSVRGHTGRGGLDSQILEHVLEVQLRVKLQASRVSSWHGARNARVRTSAVSMVPALMREGSITIISYSYSQSEQAHERTGSASPSHGTTELELVPTKSRRKIIRAVRAESSKYASSSA